MDTATDDEILAKAAEIAQRRQQIELAAAKERKLAKIAKFLAATAGMKERKTYLQQQIAAAEDEIRMLEYKFVMHYKERHSDCNHKRDEDGDCFKCGYICNMKL